MNYQDGDVCAVRYDPFPLFITETPNEGCYDTSPSTPPSTFLSTPASRILQSSAFFSLDDESQLQELLQAPQMSQLSTTAVSPFSSSFCLGAPLFSAVTASSQQCCAPTHQRTVNSNNASMQLELLVTKAPNEGCYQTTSVPTPTSTTLSIPS